MQLALALLPPVLLCLRSQRESFHAHGPLRTMAVITPTAAMLWQRLNTLIDMENLTQSLKPNKSSIHGARAEKADEPEDMVLGRLHVPVKPQHPARPGTSLAFGKCAWSKACTQDAGLKAAPAFPTWGSRVRTWSGQFQSTANKPLGTDVNAHPALREGFSSPAAVIKELLLTIQSTEITH